MEGRKKTGDLRSLLGTRPSLMIPVVCHEMLALYSGDCDELEGRSLTGAW